MKLEKKDILKALETITVPGEGQNMVESGAVKNIVTFGDEVIVDITIKNPSLQARKKTEVEILQAIHKHVYEKAKIKVNVKVDAQEKPQAGRDGRFDLPPPPASCRRRRCRAGNG